MERTVLEFINSLTVNELLASIFLAIVLILFVNIIDVASSSERMYRLNKWFRIKLPRKVKGVFKKKA
jgi:hypothetical protein